MLNRIYEAIKKPTMNNWNELISTTAYIDNVEQISRSDRISLKNSMKSLADILKLVKELVNESLIMTKAVYFED